MRVTPPDDITSSTTLKDLFAVTNGCAFMLYPPNETEGKPALFAQWREPPAAPLKRKKPYEDHGLLPEWPVPPMYDDSGGLLPAVKPVWPRRLDSEWSSDDEPSKKHKP